MAAKKEKPALRLFNGDEFRCLEYLEAGYDGFMAGKRLVIPGVGNKIVSLLPKFLPRGLVLKTLESYQRGRGRRAEGWRKPK